MTTPSIRTIKTAFADCFNWRYDKTYHAFIHDKTRLFFYENEMGKTHWTIRMFTAPKKDGKCCLHSMAVGSIVVWRGRSVWRWMLPHCGWQKWIPMIKIERGEHK